MSSNYKILLHFIKHFNTSLRIGLGLRNRSIDDLVSKDLLKDIKDNVNKNCNTFESIVNKNKFKQNIEKSVNNSRNVCIFGYNCLKDYILCLCLEKTCYEK